MEWSWFEKMKMYLEYVEKHKFIVSTVATLLMQVIMLTFGFSVHSYELGYYNYFGFGEDYILEPDNNTMYKVIICFSLLSVYCCYLWISREVLARNKGVLAKVTMFVLLPLTVMWHFHYRDFTFILCNLLLNLFFILDLAFFTGIGIKDLIKSFLPISCVKSKEKYEKGNYLWLGIGGISIILVVLFYLACERGMEEAQKQREFGIVTVQDSSYAVLRQNQDYFFLIKCNYNDDILYLSKGRCLKTQKADKEVEIYIFKQVVCEEAD